MAVAALTLGIVSLIAWLLPFLGFPVALASIIVGIITLVNKQNRIMGTIGILGGAIGLTLSIINSILGILFFAASSG